MFGKKKCSAAPQFRQLLLTNSDAQEREALAALTCESKAEMVVGKHTAPNAAVLVEAAKRPDAVWLHGRTLECSRCNKTCHVTVARPDNGSPPNSFAVRAKARPDFYALQHAFLPEWFLNQPAEAMNILSSKLDGWQASTMKQIGGIVERTPGDPMPITSVQIVGTPGEITSLLIDFIPPCAPIEAHYALLVGGHSPRYLMSEKTHLGEDQPLKEMAGITEWSFANRERSEMKHSAIDLLPDTSRTVFYQAAIELLKHRMS